MRPMSQKLRLHLGPCGLVVPLSISYGRCLGFYPSQVGFACYYQKLRMRFPFIYTKTSFREECHDPSVSFSFTF